MNDKWIPVSERLPEEGTLVLVLCAILVSAAGSAGGGKMMEMVTLPEAVLFGTMIGLGRDGLPAGEGNAPVVHLHSSGAR